MPDVTDATERSRFQAEVDGRTAVLDYRYEQDGRVLRLVHTKVPEELEGRGIGSALVRHALDSARDRGLEVWPECPFVGSYIRRHPEYLDLVTDAFPERDDLRREGGE
jgi:hypothetical protein